MKNKHPYSARDMADAFNCSVPTILDRLTKIEVREDDVVWVKNKKMYSTNVYNQIKPLIRVNPNVVAYAQNIIKEINNEELISSLKEAIATDLIKHGFADAGVYLLTGKCQ